ncbi:cytochrome c oxidase subunit ApiCOX14, putative [Hepatocystis sp. ex Piliocolobus tephrosceles]|nr:cytochrome c oxidase subunit ApiCOX14, putative [Hepatocystis sp. ex Piliocolobus tephrosceles]
MNLNKLFFSVKADTLSKSKVGNFIKNGSNEINKGLENYSSGKKLIYVNKPTHGGPIYWKCREIIHNIKKKTKRCSRYLELNHDFGRAALVGVPKTNYDPKNNIIYIQMDNEEWAGIGSKMMLNISMNILFYLHISFWIYFIYYRMLVNNKLNVFSKWKKSE